MKLFDKSKNKKKNRNFLKAKKKKKRNTLGNPFYRTAIGSTVGATIGYALNPNAQKKRKTRKNKKGKKLGFNPKKKKTSNNSKIQVLNAENIALRNRVNKLTKRLKRTK